VAVGTKRQILVYLILLKRLQNFTGLSGLILLFTPGPDFISPSFEIHRNISLVQGVFVIGICKLSAKSRGFLNAFLI
jgi:hypothetical protein